MEELEVIISNGSLMAEDFYNNGSVVLKIKKDVILNVVLRNDSQILIRSVE